MILSGHLHLGYVRSHGTVKENAAISGEEGANQGALLVVQAATATSTRLRGEPNAYNWIRIHRGGASVEVRAWNGSGWTSIQPRALQRHGSRWH
jgi:hypothetical protein